MFASCSGYEKAVVLAATVEETLKTRMLAVALPVQATVQLPMTLKAACPKEEEL